MLISALPSAKESTWDEGTDPEAHMAWGHAANERAIRAYRACGFVEEGRMREHVWLAGRYVDNLIMGVLREEE